MTIAQQTLSHSLFHLEQSETGWRENLQQLPDPHPLQSWTWGRFKSRWGWSASPLLLELEDGQPPSAAALVLKRRLPRLPFSILYVPKGPLLDYSQPALRRVVLAQLEQIARREKAIFVKIDPDVVWSWGLEKERRSPVGAKFVEELQERGWQSSDEQIQFRNTVELDLQRSEDDLLAAMKQKTRYNVRLAGRRGVTVRRGTPADFATIAAMYEETAERDEFTIRPIDYYLDIWNAFYDAGLAQPLLAEYEGTALGAVIIVRYGEKAIYMYGASTDHERQRMPNYLLQWEAIRWAQEQGCTLYDFWGAPDRFDKEDPLWGVWRFKSGFNGQVVRHIGAWDFPARPLLYQLYRRFMPRYLAWLRSRGTGAG